MIQLTNNAITQLNKLKEKRGLTDIIVRVIIKGLGWGGPIFGIALDEQKENDYEQENDGIKLVVEESLLNQFQGFKVDYRNGWVFKGFEVYASRNGSSCK